MTILLDNANRVIDLRKFQCAHGRAPSKQKAKTIKCVYFWLVDFRIFWFSRFFFCKQNDELIWKDTIQKKVNESKIKERIKRTHRQNSLKRPWLFYSVIVNIWFVALKITQQKTFSFSPFDTKVQKKTSIENSNEKKDGTINIFI